MITINHYLTINKHNDQLQDNKEQIQCKIQGRQTMFRKNERSGTLQCVE